jgi:hypothetical protein
LIPVNQKIKETLMKTNVGVWIDNRKAVCVRITDDVEEVHSIVSKMETQVPTSGREKEDRQEPCFTNHHNEYYVQVTSFLHTADSIFILGPGKAKVELKTRLESEALGARIAGIETVNTMTDYQIAAKFLKHFLNSSKTIRPSKTHQNNSD